MLSHIADIPLDISHLLLGWVIFSVYVSNAFSHPLCTHNNQGFAGRAGLWLDEGGQPGLQLWDWAGGVRAVLALEEDGQPYLQLLDAEERVLFDAP